MKKEPKKIFKLKFREKHLEKSRAPPDRGDVKIPKMTEKDGEIESNRC